METKESSEAVTDLDIDATPEEVWHALTSDQGWSDWMGQDSTIGTGVGDDLYVTDPVTGEPKRGQIDEFDEAQRLGYHWWPEQAPQHASHVSITLTPCETGTRVTVIESTPGTAVCSVATAAGSLRTAPALWCWRLALISMVSQSAGVALSRRF